MKMIPSVLGALFTILVLLLIYPRSSEFDENRSHEKSGDIILTTVSKRQTEPSSSQPINSGSILANGTFERGASTTQFRVIKKTSTSIHLEKSTISRKIQSGQLIRTVEVIAKDPTSEDSMTIGKIEALAEHVIVTPNAGVNLNAIETDLAIAGFRVIGREPDSFLTVAVEEPGRLESQPETIRKINDILLNKGISEPDFLYYPASNPNDSYFEGGRLWGLGNDQNSAEIGNIDAVSAWSIRTDASEVIVAVTDTGMRVTHEDLAANLWLNPGEIQGDGIDNDNNGIIDDLHGINAIEMNDDLSDESGHGTHVAGTIGAQGNNELGTVGVCWDVQLMGLRFIGPDGGSASAAVRAINYARENGAHIINASWGGEGQSQAIRNAVLQCKNEGILFVAAAGNSSSNIDEVAFFPASIDLDNVITVAASNREDHLAGFSSYGRYTVDLAAPGTDIVSTFSNSDSDYEPNNGTSMAAPHVSGALALARAHFPEDSAADLKTRLLTSCDQIPALEAVTSTGGRLNLRKLLAESTLIPSHDAITNPLTIHSNYGFWRGRNDRASRETIENELSASTTGQRSLWFSWTAPHAGSTSITFAGDEANVSFVLFSKDETGDLQSVASANSESGQEKQIQFEAEENAEYLILLDSFFATSTSIRLFLQPENDNFVEAVDLSPEGFEEIVNNRGATKELFEENLEIAPFSGFHSLWWTWTPSKTNSYLLTTQGSRIDTILEIFTLPPGGDLSNLSLLNRNDDVGFFDQSSAISLNLEKDQKYFIRVQSVNENQAGQIFLQGRPIAEPEITFQPQPLNLEIGGAGEFEVGVTGDFLNYQWFFNGNPIPGADTSTYRLRGVSLAQFGEYSVTISNPVGIVMSTVVNLQEMRTAPMIDWISSPQAASIGGDLRLAVGASGSRPLTYQWSKDDILLPNQTESSLSILLSDESQSGLYQVTITNDQGAITSEKVRVGLIENPLQEWQHVNTRAVGAAISEMKYANDHFVAVSIISEGYLVRSSTDGRAWKSTFLEIPGTLTTGYQETSLAYGNGIWLLAAPSLFGRNELLFYRSYDLETWETLVIDSSHLLTSAEQDPVVFSNGFFYASLNGRVIKSQDGEVWNFEFVNGQIVMGHILEPSPIGLLALRTDESTGAFLSPSGTWQNIQLYPSQGGFRPSWIKWHQGRFVVYTANDFHVTSADGINWQQESGTNGFGIKETLLDNSEQLAAFDPAGSRYSVSSDGVNWEIRKPLWSSVKPSVVAGTGDSFVIGTEGGNLIYGDDIETVSTPDSQFPLVYNQPTTITTGGGRFIIPFYSAGLVSSDGFTWKYETFYNSQTLERLDFATNYFGTSSNLWLGTTFGDTGAAAFKADSHSSLFRPVPFTNIEGETLEQIQEGPLGLIAIIKKTEGGRSYGVTRSTDNGDTWNEISLPPELQLPTNYNIQLLEANGVYYFARGGEVSYATTDLVNWTEVPFFINSPNLAFANGKFWWLEPSREGMRSSNDGLNWTDPIPTSHSSSYFRKLAAFGDTLVAFEANGSIFISEDGSLMVNAGLPFRVKNFAILEDTIIVLGTKSEIARTTLAPRNTPRVEILSPRADTEVLARSILVEVDAYDPNSEISPALTLFVDGNEIVTIQEAPYRFSLPSLSTGNHHLRALAVNSDGSTSSDEVNFSVTRLARSVSGQGLTFEPSEINYHSGIFFALKYGNPTGKIAMSPDGSDWREVSFPVGVQGIKSMTFANGIILVEAYMVDRSTKFLVSDDGLGWAVVDMPFDRLYVRSNHSGFFASNESQHFSSVDGINWTKITSVGEIPEGQNVVGNPDHVLYTFSNGSPDGTLWASFNRGRSWVDKGRGDFSTLTYENGVLFVSKLSGDQPLGVSSDGIDFTWIERPGEIYHAGGRFFASTNDHDARQQTSIDGITWVEIQSDVKLGTISFQPSIGYLAVVGPINQSPLSSNLHWSEDGLSWESLDLPAPDGLPSPRYFQTAGGLLSKTSNGGYFILDGDERAWVRLTPDHFQSSSPYVRHFEKTADGRIFGQSNNGKCFQSNDEGLTWITPEGVTGNTSYIGIHENEVILYDTPTRFYFHSKNGGSFERVDFVLGEDDNRVINFDGLTSLNGKWFLSGDYGKFYESADGRSWTEIEATGLPASRPAFSLTAVPGGIWGTYGYATSRKHVFTTNGIDWEDIDFQFNSSRNLDQILGFGNDIIINNNGKAWRSSDRVNFTIMSTPLESDFFTVSFRLLPYNDSLLATANGDIYQSTDGVTWELFRDLEDGAFAQNSPAVMELAGATILVGAEQGLLRFPLNPLDEVDLQVANLEVEAKDYGVGEQLEFSFILSRNPDLGELDGEVEVELFLTRDRFDRNSDDLPLGSFFLSWPEDADDSFEVTRQITLPETIEPGDFYLGIKLDPDRTLSDPFFENGITLSAISGIHVPAYVLSLSTNGAGMIDLNQTGTVFAKGSQVALSALAGGSSRFAGWNGDVIGGVSDITVVMTQNINIEARFQEFSELRIEVRGNGSVTPGDSITNHPVGATVDLSATPAPGWVFAGWSGDLVTTTNETSISLPNNKRLVATFTLNYADWVESNFLGNDPLSIKQESADPDQDGVTNLEEWLHGSDPKDRTLTGIQESGVRGPWLVIVYQRQNVGISNASVIAKGSRNLRSWSQTEVQQRVIENKSGIETIEAKMPLSEGTKGFFRLEYQQPE